MKSESLSDQGLILYKILPEAQPTDPGYRVYNENFLFDQIDFVIILATEITKKFKSMGFIRCASGNVSQFLFRI